mmetsp:Transcript_5272/g.11319  ORF Transcript_5272/g.11319 Transcript_5272/m.11319 type:complete len:222 (+) Transcript_5272:166-831(+)
MDAKRAKARTEALRASASERTCQSGSVAVSGGAMRTRNPSPMDSRRSSWRFPCRQARYHVVQAELVHPSPIEIRSLLRAARMAASQSTIAPQRWQGKRRSCWAWKASLLSVEFPDPTPLWFPGLHGYPLSARGPSRGMHRLSFPSANSLQSFFFIDETLKALAASIAASVCCSATCRARLRSLRSLTAAGTREMGDLQELISSCLTVQRPSLCLLMQTSGG